MRKSQKKVLIKVLCFQLMTAHKQPFVNMQHNYFVIHPPLLLLTYVMFCVYLHTLLHYELIINNNVFRVYLPQYSCIPMLAVLLQVPVKT